MNVLIETKNEYEHQFIKLAKPFVHKYFRGLYDKVKSNSASENDVLQNFQLALRGINAWTDDDKELRVNELIKITRNSFELVDLVNAIVKAYTCVYVGCMNNTINVQVVLVDFVYNIYVNCASVFFAYPVLFYDIGPIAELLRNKRDIDVEIGNAIREAIRSNVPLKETLRLFMGSNEQVIEKPVPQPAPKTIGTAHTLTENDKARIAMSLKKGDVVSEVSVVDNSQIVERYGVKNALEEETDGKKMLEDAVVTEKAPMTGSYRVPRK